MCVLRQYLGFHVIYSRYNELECKNRRFNFHNTALPTSPRHRLVLPNTQRAAKQYDIVKCGEIKGERSDTMKVCYRMNNISAGSQSLWERRLRLKWSLFPLLEALCSRIGTKRGCVRTSERSASSVNSDLCVDLGAGNPGCAQCVYANRARQSSAFLIPSQLGGDATTPLHISTRASFPLLRASCVASTGLWGSEPHFLSEELSFMLSCASTDSESCSFLSALIPPNLVSSFPVLWLFSGELDQ